MRTIKEGILINSKASASHFQYLSDQFKVYTIYKVGIGKNFFKCFNAKKLKELTMHYPFEMLLNEREKQY